MLIHDTKSKVLIQATVDDPYQFKQNSNARKQLIRGKKGNRYEKSHS